MKTLMNSLKNFARLIFGLFIPQKHQRSILEEEAVLSPGKLIVRNFLKNKTAILGLVMFSMIFVIVFGGSSIIPLNLLGGDDAILRNLPPNRSYLRVDSSLDLNNINKIVSGRSFSVAIDNNGKAHFWGIDNLNVADIERSTARFTQIVAGDRHVIALDTNGELHLFGFNNHQQASVPNEVRSAINGRRIKQVGAGDLYTSVLTEDGYLISWGATLVTRVDIVPEEYQGRISKISTSNNNILLILDDHTIGFVGLRGSQLANIPEYLTDGTVKVVAVESTSRAGLALSDQGEIFLWGESTNNQLNSTVPSGVKVAEIASGRDYFVVLGENKEVYGWGGNHFGQLDFPQTTDISRIFIDFYQNYALTTGSRIVSWGNEGFLLGSDDFGRDMLTRLLHGGRITMTVGAVAVLISSAIGLLIGLIAGFYGKRIDNILMRFAEIVSSFPFLPLAITLSAFIGQSLSQNERIFLIMAILGVISWPGLSRLIRGQILSEREKEFVLAARAIGVKSNKIIFRHILPNVINVLIVSMTLSYAGSLLTEAGLSFLGFGVVPPSPSWGNMLTGSQTSEVIQFMWWRWLLPASAVLLTALSINLVGDGLREAMDPRSNEK